MRTISLDYFSLIVSYLYYIASPGGENLQREGEVGVGRVMLFNTLIYSGLQNESL